MKVAWAILLISALTDAAVAFGTGLMVGNAATGATYPEGPTMFYAGIGAGLVFARTIQQGLKAALGGSEGLLKKTEDTLSS